MEELLTEGETSADLGVERLAGRAGISRTSFSFYFRDKREVLERLTVTVAGELYAAAEIWWSGPGISAAALRTSIEDVSARFVQHGPLLRAIVEVGTYEREVAEHWRSLIGRFVDATEERILLEQAASPSSRASSGRGTSSSCRTRRSTRPSSSRRCRSCGSARSAVAWTRRSPRAPERPGRGRAGADRGSAPRAPARVLDAPPGQPTGRCSPVIAENSPVSITRATSASISSSVIPGRALRRRRASSRRSFRISSTVTR